MIKVFNIQQGPKEVVLDIDDLQLNKQNKGSYESEEAFISLEISPENF